MSTTIASIDERYALGHSLEEQDRLDRQGLLLRPATERWLRDAGLRPGMRVLDIGCGTGDLTRQAARIVGPTGFVLGVDRSRDVIETARDAAWHFEQVAFTDGDINRFESDELFDALIGRLVLMYQPDPAETLLHLSRFVRPGGIVAIADYFFLKPTAIPARPLYAQVFGWIVDTLRSATPNADLGARLHRIFGDAGLDHPTVRFEAVAGAGCDPAFEQMPVDILRTLLPIAERFGIATSANVQIDTLHERLLAESLVADGVAFGPIFATAFARLSDHLD